MIPLIMAATGDKFTVKEIRGGINLTKKLYNMGIYTGITIEVVNNTGSGPVVVAIEGSRIGIGHKMAYKIMGDIV